MNAQSWLLVGGFCLLALVSCSPKADTVAVGKPSADHQAAGFTTSSTSADIHSALLNPASDALYAAEADAPTTSEGWAAVQRAAEQMIGATLMQTGSRPAGRPEWIRISKLVEAAARRSAEAARAKNVELLAAADGDFTAQCEDCHNTFRDAPGRGMTSEPGQ
jgi:hypothetical protein